MHALTDTRREGANEVAMLCHQDTVDVLTLVGLELQMSRCGGKGQCKFGKEQADSFVLIQYIQGKWRVFLFLFSQTGSTI